MASEGLGVQTLEHGGALTATPQQVMRAWILRLMRMSNDHIVTAPSRKGGRVMAWRWVNSYAQNILPVAGEKFGRTYGRHVRAWVNARNNPDRDVVLQSLLLECNREAQRFGVFGNVTDQIVSIEHALVQGME